MLVLRHVFCIFSIQNTCLACGTRVIYLYTQPATLASKYMLWTECICKMLVSNYIRYKNLCSMLSPHYISTRPAMLASRYILSATCWTILWKGLDRENLPSFSFQCCIHVYSFPMSYDFASMSFQSPFVSWHFFFISFHFGHSFPFMFHSCPFAFISFHFDKHFLLILFILFFPFFSSIFVFISLHFACVSFHFPFISF